LELCVSSVIMSASAGNQSEKGSPGPWLGGHGQSSRVLSRQLGTVLEQKGPEGYALLHDCNQATPSYCEIGAGQREPEPWNTKAEESTSWRAVSKLRSVKTQQTEKI
jgi:hypothetical protein